MRVEVQLDPSQPGEPIKVPWENRSAGARYVDLREDAAALAQIEPARRHRPLHSLLAALNSADSVFSSIRCAAWLDSDEPAPAGPPGGEAGASEFASRVDLVFAEEEMNSQRALYEGLIQQLQDLLTRDAGDALRVRLALLPCKFHDAGQKGFALSVQLFARGETPGQAELRWGLGLVRVQQALLFVSRVIRHHLTHPAQE